MDRQWCPMMSQGKTPSSVGAFHLERPIKSCKLKFEGSFQVNCSPQKLERLPGLSLGHHWRFIVYQSITAWKIKFWAVHHMISRSLEFLIFTNSKSYGFEKDGQHINTRSDYLVNNSCNTLQIYTVFNCVPLSTVISLYGLHLIALYSPM